MGSAIKRIAGEAKKRLKNGYWEDLYKSRDEDLKIAKQKGVPGDFVVDAYKQRLHSTRNKSVKKIADEGKMYSKVYDIVLRENDGETVYNPIGILKDDDYYNTLDSASREKYVFELSDIYVGLKKKIEREMKIKSLKS